MWAWGGKTFGPVWSGMSLGLWLSCTTTVGVVMAQATTTTTTTAAASNNGGSEFCTLCPDGSDIQAPYPDRAINIPGPSNPFAAMGVTTCGQVQGLLAVAAFDAHGAECGLFRLLAVYCGCPRSATACSFCPMVEQEVVDDLGETTTLWTPAYITTPDSVRVELEQQEEAQKTNTNNATEEEEEYRFDFLAPLLGWSPNCAQMESIAAANDAGSDDCDLTQLLAVECDCTAPPVVPKHFGARNRRQQDIILILPKFSAILSLMGSALIVRDILFGKQQQQQGNNNNNSNSRCGAKLQTYQVIMLAMSLFDIIGCLAWSLSQHAVPQGFKPGAVGTMGTCRTAAFMTQLSFTATFYNACLCLYYYLTISRGFRERDLAKIKYGIYLIPPMIGLTLAAWGWNKYSAFSIWGCYFPIPPIAESYRNIYLFAIAPIGTAVLLCTVLMAMICWDVRQKVLRSMQWTMSNTDSRFSHPSASAAARPQQQSPTTTTAGAAAADSNANLSSDDDDLPESNEEGPATPPTTTTTQTTTVGDTSTQTPPTAAASSSSLSTTVASSARQLQRRLSTSRRSDRPPRADHDVFWQSIFYLGALYVCWPILLYSFSIKHYSNEYYAFHVVFFICAPLQGFLNALVYFRPRFIRYLRDRRRERQRRERSTRNGQLEMPSTSTKTNSTVTTVDQSSTLAVKKLESVREEQAVAIEEGNSGAP